jgi:hypothetical protein
MKISKYLALGLLVFGLTPVWGQTTFTIENSQSPAPDTKNLTTFDLNFPGGPPSELVNQIQKATGKPLNVIIPSEYAQEDLPPLKMSHVNVVQLFQALQSASVKDEPYVTSRFPGNGGGGGGGIASYSRLSTSYGFKTDASPVTDDSIWYFYGRDKVGKTPAEPPPVKIVRFFQLSPYLDRGFTVDDITTAIQTGWKMEGPETPPQISYHKETKMLIAYGEAEKLNTISEVLQTLPAVGSDYWQQMNKNMGQLQQQIKELQNKISAPPPLSPEAQVIQMEANRVKSLQAPSTILPPTPVQPQATPEKPKAGQ